MKARDIANQSAGIDSLLGNAELEVTHISAADRSSPGSLVFLKSKTLEELPPDLRLGKGIAIVCGQGIASIFDDAGPDALLISENPRLSFMQLANACFPSARPKPGVHPLAWVDPSSTIEPTASVGAFCFVGPDCVLGQNTVLHPNVVLYERVRIGANVTIHAGAVIGADGFGYERTSDGTLQKFPHIGGVVIEDDVDVGSNTSIDRGSFGDTILRRGCKVDNQIHVAHNVDIGEDAVVIAQSLIGGSVRIGDRAWVAPAAVIMNQVQIGAESTVGLAAVVTRNVPEREIVMGSPAIPQAEFKELRAALKTLVDGR